MKQIKDMNPNTEKLKALIFSMEKNYLSRKLIHFKYKQLKNKMSEMPK